MSLTLTRRRLPLSAAVALDASEEKQIMAVLASEGAGTIDRAREDEAWSGLELIDVLRDGQLSYRMVLYPFGSGVLYEGTSTKELLDIVQHGIELRDGTPVSLIAELEAAFARDAKKLGIAESIDFRAPKQKPKPLAPEAILALTEPKIARRKELSDDEVTAVFRALKMELSALDGALTAERLSPLGRRLATVMARGGRFMLKRLADLGLPSESSALEVWLGLREATGLQRTLAVKGREASILEHARAVVKGTLDGDALIDALTALPEAESLFILDRMLRFDPDERITSFPWDETKTSAARWLVKLVNRLGAPAIPMVRKLLIREGVSDAARIYVWSQVTPNIRTIPAAVAAKLPYLRDSEHALLPEILAKLPEAARILSGATKGAVDEPAPKTAKAKATKPKVKAAQAKPEAKTAKAKAQPKPAKPKAKPPKTKTAQAKAAKAKPPEPKTKAKTAKPKRAKPKTAKAKTAKAKTAKAKKTKR